MMPRTAVVPTSGFKNWCPHQGYTAYTPVSAAPPPLPETGYGGLKHCAAATAMPLNPTRPPRTSGR